MKTILIYKSVSGFTKKYADWIKEEINCDIESIKNINKINFDDYDLVIYGSRIYAGMLDNLAKVNKYVLDKDFIVFATGATKEESDEIKMMWKKELSNEQLEKIPHFYFPAGMNYNKLALPDKLLIKLFRHMVKNKKELTEQERNMINSITTPFDNSKKEYIKPLIDCINKRK